MAAKVELDIALRMDLRRSREGKGKSAVGGDAFGAQGDDDKSFDKMVARYASATLLRKKRVSMESSSLTSSRDRFALDE